MTLIHINFILGCTICAAILNRFRGGGIFLMPWETVDHKSTQIRRIVYALFFGLITWNPLVAATVFLSLLTGWGYPVSTAIKAKTTGWEAQFTPLDKATQWLVGSASPHVYGVVWLTLHGLFFGAITAAFTHSFWPLLWASMGLCYKYARDWERGEILYGMIQGFTVALVLTTL